jgi:hypothetical protein
VVAVSLPQNPKTPFIHLCGNKNILNHEASKLRVG